MGRRDVQRFYRFHAPIYDWTRPLFLWGRKRAVDILDVRPDHLILDVGCGTGLNYPHLLRYRPKHIVGVDVSSDMLQKARGKGSVSDVLLADLNSLPLMPRADRALCTYALSMLENPEKALGEIAQCLRPDGQLVLLDFHSFRPPFLGFNRPFSWWLSRNHVFPAPPPLALLKRHFRSVNLEIPKFGYYYLARAYSPLRPHENFS